MKKETLEKRAELDPQWAHILEYISRGTAKGQMPNLERIQRAAGSLGKLAGEVRCGLNGPTFEELGRTIGTLPPLSGKP